AELAVQTPRPRQSNLVTVRLARTPTALYVAETHLTRGRRQGTSVGKPPKLPVPGFTSSYHMPQEAERVWPGLDASTVCMETNSTQALTAGATAGLGIAVLPRFVARRHEELASVSEDTAAHDVWLITHPEFRRDPKVRAVVEFLKTIAVALEA